MKALAVSGATRPVTGGAGQASNGYGGIDAASFHNGSTITHDVFGGRQRWSVIESQVDGLQDNRARVIINVPQNFGNARVAMSVMKNPDLIWPRRNTARPLGTDLNFSVFGPNGAYLGGSYDWRDSVEVLDFQLVGSGNYRVEITQAWAIGDPAIEIGLAFNWDL